MAQTAGRVMYLGFDESLQLADLLVELAGRIRLEGKAHRDKHISKTLYSYNDDG